MADMLFGLHSGVRYLVLAAWLVAMVGALSSLRHGGSGKAGRVTMLIFIGLLDLQFLIGLVLLLNWDFHPQLFGHVLTMLIAVFAAHGFVLAQRRATPARPRRALPVVGLLITLLLIVAGIASIGRPIL